MSERGLIYFPVHLTSGYEVAIKSAKFASDVSELLLRNKTKCVFSQRHNNSGISIKNGWS